MWYMKVSLIKANHWSTNVNIIYPDWYLYLRPWKTGNSKFWGFNLGPSTCKTDVLPLCYGSSKPGWKGKVRKWLIPSIRILKIPFPLGIKKTRYCFDTFKLNSAMKCVSVSKPAVSPLLVSTVITIGLNFTLLHSAQVDLPATNFCPSTEIWQEDKLLYMPHWEAKSLTIQHMLNSISLKRVSGEKWSNIQYEDIF